jgi:hypothetical protein
MAVRAMGRRDDVAVLQRAADPDGTGLLTDRDMQEAGQLPRAEALLHLLLEPPDEQHLAEELAQLGVAERGLLLDLRHSGQFTYAPAP